MFNKQVQVRGRAGWALSRLGAEGHPGGLTLPGWLSVVLSHLTMAQVGAEGEEQPGCDCVWAAAGSVIIHVGCFTANKAGFPKGLVPPG